MPKKSKTTKAALPANFDPKKNAVDSVINNLLINRDRIHVLAIIAAPKGSAKMLRDNGEECDGYHTSIDMDEKFTPGCGNRTYATCGISRRLASVLDQAQPRGLFG